jgi:hypothetical protein
MKRSIVSILLVCAGMVVIVVIVAGVVRTRVRMFLRTIGRATRRFYRRVRPRWLEG